MTIRPIRVALYARVSTDMQAEEGLSIPAQLSEMQEFVAHRSGWHIVAEFTDPAHSGSSMNRPGLLALLQTIEQGDCDVVLVHELSRLSRSLFDTFRLFELLGQHDIGFASVKDPDFDFSTPTGRLFLTIIAAVNQYYLDLIKQHTAKGKRERARQGLYNASITPYGYRHVGDSKTPPEIVEEEAPAVRLAFETYCTGNASYQDVADRLNEQGYRTRSGGRFSKDTVDDMLRNAFYAGYTVYGTTRKGQTPELFEGQHKAIISREMFEACQQVREKRRGAARSYQPQFRVYLLNAISNCSLCGRTLRAQGAKANRYYREMSRERGFIDCPNAQRGVVADAVEGQIEAIFRHLELPADWQQEVEALLDREAELEALNNRRARLKAELRRLREMYMKGNFDDDPDHYDYLHTRLQRELDTLPTSDLGAIEEAAETLTHLAQVWGEADMELKRELIRLVLNQVEIDVQQKRIVNLAPGPAFLPLLRHSKHLVEVEPGRFIPLWPPELAEKEDPAPCLSPLTQPQLSPRQALAWPFILALPEPPTQQRITPVLSQFLKKRRQAGSETGHIVEVPHPVYPQLRLDERKWPGWRMQTIKLSGDEPPSVDLPEGALSFLHTPFVLQRSEYRTEWLSEAARLLDAGGWWILIEEMPQSMPGHWIYRYFPEAWDRVKQLNLAPSSLYTRLQEYGFKVNLKQQSYYQAISCATALAMVEQRPAGSVLHQLSGEAYQEGLTRLSAECRTLGAEGLLASQICIAEIIASRPNGNKKPRRGGG